MLVKPDFQPVAKIKVVGVGGAGGNAINTMISDYDIQGVEFYAVNTDAQALKNSLANTVAIGEELTRGLGVGGNPDIGRQAAEESMDLLHEHLSGADMVFVTAGMGGGTGTGAAPVVANVAKGHGALTVGVITKPFDFEGKKRMENALLGIEAMREAVDTLIIVPNQRILEIIAEDVSFLDAMKKSDEVLVQAVRSIAGLVTNTGFINVDFADVKTVMSGAGSAMMGMGSATGDDRALKATQQAINSPLLEMSIDGATGVLINVIGGKDMSMKEVQRAGDLVHEVVDADATIIFGATIDENLEGELQVTVLATGFDEASNKQGRQSVIESVVGHGGSAASMLNDDEMMDAGNPAGTNRVGGLSRAGGLDVSGGNAGRRTSHTGEGGGLGGTSPTVVPKKDDGIDEDELEIPAFMRKKG